MSLPNPNFAPGDQFTADHVNGIIDAIIEKLQVNSFNSTDLTGSEDGQTIFQYDVPSDKYQIIQINSYLNIRTQDQQCVLNVGFTDPYDNYWQLLTQSGTPFGFYSGNTITICAKKGTSVFLYFATIGNAICDVGGSFMVLKSI